MRESSIAKQSAAGPGTPLAVAIGQEIRRRRIAAGLSQAEVGGPFSRAFVSAVEHGHAVPSLASLVILADRLATDAATLLGSVNHGSTGVYDGGNGDDST
jgi:transcriptional regulator with XRE-family HTH domain